MIYIHLATIGHSCNVSRNVSRKVSRSARTGVSHLGKYKKKPEAPVVRVRIPRDRDREVLATVEAMLGALHLKVRCLDGTVRIARIPGKMKKRIWIRENDVVIIVPWSFQDEKADVVWRYTAPQADWLRRRGYLS